MTGAGAQEEQPNFHTCSSQCAAEREEGQAGQELSPALPCPSCAILHSSPPPGAKGARQARRFLEFLPTSACHKVTIPRPALWLWCHLQYITQMTSGMSMTAQRSRQCLPLFIVCSALNRAWCRGGRREQEGGEGERHRRGDRRWRPSLEESSLSRATWHTHGRRL